MSQDPRRPSLPIATTLALATALVGGPGCVQPHCSSPNYGEAECRVIAENVHARLRSAQGVELRFQAPEATDDATWDARGLLESLADGTVGARVAGPGRFAISLRADPNATADTVVQVRLSNVDPDAVITVGPADAAVELPPLDSNRQRIEVVLAPGQLQWIRGERPCPSRYRLAIVGDIQTNPTQFERIIDRLQQEADDAAATPLVGLLVVGDLTEASRDDEMQTIAQILARAPVPVAVTAGNHDIYRPTRPHFNRRFGPGNHAFDVCGAHVTMLDSGSGAIARSVEARLPELLHREDGRFLIAGMHHPPYPGLTGSGWSREDQAAALLAELARERADLVVAGHNHALRAFDVPVGDVTLPEVIVGTGGAFQGVGIPRYGYLRVELDDETGTLSRCFVEVPPVGYAEPPNEPPSGLSYCTAP